MNAKVRRFLYRIMQKLLSIKPTQIAVIGFLMIILIGTLLLSLPFATRAPGSAPFLTALFTATSSTCVTGLVLHDTFTYWSGMGQSVILLLIQLGGLGFMTLVVIFAFLLHRTIGLRQRLVMAQLLNLNDISGVVRLMRHILIWTFLCEGIGAVILSVRFSLDFGVWGGIKKGVFHSVSAFCNAGFDIMGELGPGVSLTHYSADPTVVLTVCLLIIAGGLGFFAWEDIYTKRSFARFHLHTKLVLTMTAV